MERVFIKWKCNLGHSVDQLGGFGGWRVFSLDGSAISVTMKGFFKNAVIFRPVYLLIFDIVLFKNKPKQ